MSIRGELEHNFLPAAPSPPVLWYVSKNLIDYPSATEFMENYVERLAQNQVPELVWLLEHPPLYTGGTSAKSSDLLNEHSFPIYNSKRGGQYTYHGPGQRIIYLMLNLKQRKCDIRSYISTLEQWIINSLAYFNIKGERREDRVGVWVSDKNNIEKKIAAIGIRLHKWVSFHGIAINVNVNLDHYNGIVACGQKDYGLTNICALSHNISLADVDAVMKQNFTDFFGKSKICPHLPTELKNNML